jgi:hypothetical protein
VCHRALVSTKGDSGWGEGGRGGEHCPLPCVGDRGSVFYGSCPGLSAWWGTGNHPPVSATPVWGLGPLCLHRADGSVMPDPLGIFSALEIHLSLEPPYGILVRKPPEWLPWLLTILQAGEDWRKGILGGRSGKTQRSKTFYTHRPQGEEVCQPGPSERQGTRRQGVQEPVERDRGPVTKGFGGLGCYSCRFPWGVLIGGFTAGS